MMIFHFEVKKNIQKMKMKFRKPTNPFVFCFCILFLGFISSAFSQEIIMGGNMENETDWTVYYLAESYHSTYDFNYIQDLPAEGEGGCLRVISTHKNNILFWQKISLEAGKKYKMDGAVKTNYVESFWCEIFLSPIAPLEDEDYQPSGGLIWGLSTWKGCGSNLDGLFSEVSCNGAGTYITPSSDTETIEIYVGIKTGMLNDMDAPMEVLIDEISLKEIDDWRLLGTREGTIDEENKKLTGVSPFITVEKFRAGLHASASSTIDIIGKIGKTSISDKSISISDTMLVQVTGYNGTSHYQLSLRTVGNENKIIATTLGELDSQNNKISSLPKNIRIIQLKSSISISPHAIFKIFEQENKEATNNSVIDNSYTITVTSENGDAQNYAIETRDISMEEETISDVTETVNQIKNRILTIHGKSEIHITNTENPLQGSMIKLGSENSWIYFDNIKPSVVSKKYLSHFLINDETVEANKNVRIVQYLQGTVIISQPETFEPLQIFSADELSGVSMELGLYTYYRSNELGDMEDNIRSFKLKKGYMATFARDEMGTGYSKVFIADENDLIINQLPVGLHGQVSFIRVFPWRWVTKKGWTNGKKSAETLNCTWQYDWDNATSSGLDVEYVPMRHGRYWNSYENINNKQNSTHALGFNEPDREDQANMSVDDAIAQWPELLKSGLRLGSPCPSDGGLDWLYTFVNRCDQLNYRVDFVVMHWYKGGQTAQQFYNQLKTIHDKTGRPIWITEWNNGANWTCCKPTYEEQAQDIDSFLQMLDTTSFVERHSLYEWVEDTRYMFYEAPHILTPAGEVYRDKKSEMAYKSENEFFIEYISELQAASNPKPADGSSEITIDTLLTWDSDNPDLDVEYDVFFGLSEPPSYKGTQSATQFDPGQLKGGTTYYWRIDVVSSAGTTRGDIWSFTVERNDELPSVADSPSPFKGEENVNVDLEKLTWNCFDEDGDQIYFDVLLGTDASFLDVHPVDNFFFELPKLEYSTTYYWKILSYNQGSEKVEGPLWEFTTEIPTGIDKLESGSLQISPNPVKDYLTVSFSEINKELTIQVVNTKGKIIFSDECKSPFTKRINFSGYSNGLYFVRMVIDGKIITQKVMLVK